MDLPNAGKGCKTGEKDHDSHDEQVEKETAWVSVLDKWFWFGKLGLVTRRSQIYVSLNLDNDNQCVERSRWNSEKIQKDTSTG